MWLASRIAFSSVLWKKTIHQWLENEAVLYWTKHTETLWTTHIRLLLCCADTVRIHQEEKACNVLFIETQRAAQGVPLLGRKNYLECNKHRPPYARAAWPHFIPRILFLWYASTTNNKNYPGEEKIIFKYPSSVPKHKKMTPATSELDWPLSKPQGGK